MYIVEIDEEGEAISSTPLETISSTPWESVAVDVWPKLLSAFEIVRDMLESSDDELDEVKPAMVARFGKILFHPYVIDLYLIIQILFYLFDWLA